MEEGYYKHPQLEDFYKAQWGDIDNAIRRYGGRLVIQELPDYKWCCNPKYGEYPLRVKKLVTKLKYELSISNRSKASSSVVQPISPPESQWPDIKDHTVSSTAPSPASQVQVSAYHVPEYMRCKICGGNIKYCKCRQF